jgi:hypothetical protein
MTQPVLIAFFLAAAFVAWSVARATLAIDEYRATQMTPVVPVEEPLPPPQSAPEVERHISWTLDTDEFEQLHYDLLDDQRRWQARVWLDEILVDERDRLVTA